MCNGEIQKWDKESGLNATLTNEIAIFSQKKEVLKKHAEKKAEKQCLDMKLKIVPRVSD